MKSNATKVAVLMAVKNGLAYLPEQIDSILKQQHCQVKLYISDDCSTDGSLEYLKKRSHENKAIKLLPSADSLGSAARNFYRLICDVDTDGFDYIALSDQDDIWLPDKLSRHAKLAKEHHADGVSSNVTAFWPDGRERLLDKTQPQRQLDYLFESVGPGCTFLLTPWLCSKVRELLQYKSSPAKDIALHDIFIYSVCRSNGRIWHIDSTPSIKYRQHYNNTLGANVGIVAKWSRLLWLKDSRYRDDVINIATLSYQASADPEIRHLLDLLEHKSLFNQLKLLRFIPQARRKGFDRLMLAGAILLGVF